MTYIIPNSLPLQTSGSGNIDATNSIFTSTGSEGAVLKAIGNAPALYGSIYYEALISNSSSRVGVGIIPTGSSSANAASLDSQKAIVYYSNGTITNTSFATQNTVSLLALKGPEGLSVIQDSISNKTWTSTSALLSSTQFRGAGKQSLSLSGTGQFLTGINSTDFNITGNITFQAYIYCTNTAKAFNTILCKRETSGNATGWHFGLDLGRPRFFSYKAANSINLDLTAASALTANTWYHIAVVRNGTNWSIYVNGTSVASGTETSATYLANANPILLGRQNSSTVNDFQGFIDGIKIDQAALWTTTFTPPTQFSLASNLTCSGTTAYGATFSAGDRIGLRVDLGFRNKLILELYKNGVSQGILLNLGYLPGDYAAGASPLLTLDGTTGQPAQITIDRYAYYAQNTTVNTDIWGQDCLFTTTRLPPLTANANNLYIGNRKGIQAVVTTAGLPIMAAAQQKYSGKRYFEIQVSGSPTITSIYLGIKSNDAGNAVSVITTPNNGVVAYNNARSLVNGTVQTTGLPALVLNDTIGVAVDFDLGRVWFSRNGTWMTGDPATNTTPTATFPPIDALSGGFIPFVCNATGGQVTAYVIRGTAQASTGGALKRQQQVQYTVPSGFSTWSDWTGEQNWLPNGTGSAMRNTVMWADVVSKYNGYVNTEVSQVYAEVLVKQPYINSTYLSSSWSDIVQATTAGTSDTRVAQVYAEVLIRNPPPNDTRVTVMWNDIAQATSGISATQVTQIYAETLIKQPPITPDSPTNPNPGVQVTMEWADIAQGSPGTASQTQVAQLYAEVLIKNQTTTKYPIITIVG